MFHQVWGDQSYSSCITTWLRYINLQIVQNPGQVSVNLNSVLEMLKAYY